ncbi:MAG: ABC transporter ATP-binding protein [Leptospirales bacterium]|nr:ABC transporter ATP-binding protein [Leptospirales bacterium]
MSFSIEKLSFAYGKRPPTLQIDAFSAAAGERIFLYGPSGSGKTTLLGILGGVLQPQAGAVLVLAERLDRLSAARRDRFRGQHIGFLFQLFNLIPYLSALENITLPCSLSAGRRARLQGRDPRDAARELAAHLGIETALDKAVLELSVGQQQRVAAARALIGAPELIIADEPTSALDADHRESFIRLLFQECKNSGSTLLFVSHDQSLAPLFDRSVSLPQINRSAATAAL